MEERLFCSVSAPRTAHQMSSDNDTLLAAQAQVLVTSFDRSTWIVPVLRFTNRRLTASQLQVELLSLHKAALACGMQSVAPSCVAITVSILFS